MSHYENWHTWSKLRLYSEIIKSKLAYKRVIKFQKYLTVNIITFCVRVNPTSIKAVFKSKVEKYTTFLS